MYMNETASVFSTTQCHYIYRSTVYNSDINYDMYGSDSNRVNLLLKVIWYFKWRLIDYIAMPVGGEKCLLKCICLWFIQDSLKDADPSSNETSTSWVSKSYITCDFLQNYERTTTSIVKKFNLSRIMQLYFAHKQLLKSLYVACSWYSAPINGLLKRDTG